jgi:hypothetical protein
MTYAGEQMGFVEIIQAAEEADRERANQHRARTQQFFDALTEKQRDELSSLFCASEWLTCQALSAAAGDWPLQKSSAENYCGAGGCVPASAGVT